MAQPRITVTCDCGEILRINYREIGTCVCGRRYDTARIPEADYRGVLRTRRLYRRGELLFVATVVALLVALTIVGRSAPILITIPVFLVVWIRFFRPWWVARKRPKLVDLPKWDLPAE